MNKLTIKEKAIAYDKALNTAREILDHTSENYLCTHFTKEDIKDMYIRFFPELKESEDERIRKEIINFLELPHPQFVGKRDHEKWIGWLEKQKGCEYIKKDWFEHVKQSWYKEGFIDGKYSGGTSKEWTINDAATFKELIDFLENGTAKLQHDLTRYANWLKIQFTPIEKQKDINVLIQEASEKSYAEGMRIERKQWFEKQEEQKEINLVEILKHYPKETELYSPLYGKLWLAEVDEKNEIITCYKHYLEEGCTRAVLEQEDTVSFYSNGTTGLPDFNVSKDCMLFLYDITKQGEQKSDDKIEPKFKVGDFIVDNCGNVWKIEGILNQFYILEGVDGGESRPTIEWVDKTSHLWTIKDAKDGVILVANKKGQPFIFNGHYDEDTDYIYAHCGISDLVKNDSFYYNGECIEEEFKVWCINENVFPATKEQRDLLFQKMREAGWEFDFKKKELKMIEQKPIKASYSTIVKTGNGCVNAVVEKELSINGCDEQKPACSAKRPC